MKFPTYLTCTQVAAILGPEWDTRRTRRWLIGSGAAVKRGTRWVTTPEMLRRTYPEIWDELMARCVEREEEEDN